MCSRTCKQSGQVDNSRTQTQNRQSHFLHRLKVVLGCIHNKSRRFYVYVANRIQIIQVSLTFLNGDTWKQRKIQLIQQQLREKSAKDLMESVWFEGPEFLRNVDPPAQTELSPEPFLIADNNPEVRVKATIYSTQLRVITGQKDSIDSI
jgi:hypothetical protein